MLTDERFDELDDLLLLATWQPCGCIKYLAELALAALRTFGVGGLAEHFLDAHAVDVGEFEHGVRMRDFAGVLPMHELGVENIKTAGDFTQREAGAAAELSKM